MLLCCLLHHHLGRGNTQHSLVGIRTPGSGHRQLARQVDVPLTSNLRQLLLQRLLTRPQIGHLCVGVDIFEHQLGVVLPELAHLGV